MRPPTTPTEAMISIVGTGMTIEGDCETDGSLRIEGSIRGNVRAGKSVVIGKDGLLEGSIYTQDAVIAGRVLGAVYAESYLELQATSRFLARSRPGGCMSRTGLRSKARWPSVRGASRARQSPAQRRLVRSGKPRLPTVEYRKAA